MPPRRRRRVVRERTVTRRVVPPRTVREPAEPPPEEPAQEGAIYSTGPGTVQHYHREPMQAEEVAASTPPEYMSGERSPVTEPGSAR